MKQSGRQRIQAPRHAVWAALHDTNVMKRCIEGCESFQQVGDQSYKATVRAHVGPVNALFAANVEIMEEPQSDPDLKHIRLEVEIERAAAGFGRGTASVSLAEESKNVTILDYDIDAVVGGKLAQLGARLIEAAAGAMASSFFDKLQQELGGGTPARPKTDKHTIGSPALWWTAGVAILVALLAVVNRL